MEKIKVENLYKVFGPNPAEIIPMIKAGKTKDEIMEKTKHGVGVANASFTVHEGEILVVMGLSGSGKSTLVRCINRLIKPTAGRVIVDGQDVTRLPMYKRAQRGIGYLSQEPSVFQRMTVERNLLAGGMIERDDFALFKRTDDVKQAVAEILGFYGLPYWYTWQVTVLGLGPIWMSDNEAVKARTAALLEEGAVFAFGLSEKAVGLRHNIVPLRLTEV